MILNDQIALIPFLSYNHILLYVFVLILLIYLIDRVSVSDGTDDDDDDDDDDDGRGRDDGRSRSDSSDRSRGRGDSNDDGNSFDIPATRCSSSANGGIATLNNDSACNNVALRLSTISLIRLLRLFS